MITISQTVILMELGYDLQQGDDVAEVVFLASVEADYEETRVVAASHWEPGYGGIELLDWRLDGCRVAQDGVKRPATEGELAIVRRLLGSQWSEIQDRLCEMV